MLNKKILVIGETSYEAGQLYIDSCIKAAKELFESKGQMAIYATEKNNIVTMCKEVYATTEELKREIARYHQKGFKVKHTKGSK